MIRSTFVSAGLAAVLALTAPLAAAPVPLAASVVLRPANLWSFKVESRRLLADLGYSVEYTFEFYDEEEIRIVALSERTLLVEGTLRTILDGDPAYAQFRLRGEDFPFWVVLNPDGLTATRMTSDGLRPAGVPEAEIQQWIARLRSLLHDTRERLGLWDFEPSVARMVRLTLSPVDVLTLVPADDPIQRYAVSQPATSRAAEVLVVEVRGQTWSIRWALPTLTVTIGTGRRQATRSFQVPSPDATATTAVTLLRNARQQLGTTRIVLPLP